MVELDSAKKGGTVDAGRISPKRRPKYWLWLAMIASIGIAGWFLVDGLNRSVEVSAATAQEKPITGSFTAEAFVRAKTYSVVPEVSARVGRILVSEGQQVRKGEVVAELDKSDVDEEIAKAEAARASAQSQVRQATAEWKLADRESKAAIESAQARVHQAETGLRRAKVGALPEEISQAKHRVEAAQVAVDDAEKAYHRASILYKQGAVAKAVFDSAEARLKASQSQLAEVKDGLMLLERGPRSEDIDIAEAGLKSAQAELKSVVQSAGQVSIRHDAVDAANAQLRQVEADLARVRLARGKLTLYSPATGTVTRRNLEPGMMAAAGQAVATVSTREDIHIEAEVDTEDIAKVSVGMPVKVTSAAYPSQEFDGRVESIMASGELKPGSAIRTRIVRVRVSLDGGWDRFRPEMELDVEGIATLRKVLVVPSDALLYENGDAYVWRIERQTASKRKVKVGYASATESEIVKGLAVGDLVVVKGKDEVTVGAKVHQSGEHGK
ncbi:MAG: efflux RND transporter periplasmic adaptor subunit [Armatimonadetes bacterium]|nr:efflux RND transporter periplasmic adaptor subunit [Armatimonadota bacterium]